MFCELTNFYGGSPVFVKPEAVEYIRKGSDSTIIGMKGGARVYVMESPSTVADYLTALQPAGVGELK